MCGFCGFIDLALQTSYEKLKNITINMTEPIKHRGPDSEGYWIDAAAGIALGHRRLSVIDLSDEGKQPMFSASGRYIIAFNGEVYNFKQIRVNLEKINQTFRGHSDTEVILAAIEVWGLEMAVKLFVGMFAFVLWDRKERLLYLVRDRLGEKPLYYGWIDKIFLFGSELKALRSHPSFKVEIDRDALALYLRYNYIPTPYSIYKGINKLPAGTILRLDVNRQEKNYSYSSYWSPKNIIESGLKNQYLGSEKEAVDELQRLLRNTIKQQMIADVPLGAFLSGGIDSSTITAIMQEQSSRPVKTFTIGFSEADYNEADHAKKVAEHLGTDHTELYVTPEEARSVIPKLPYLYDEPFSDSSQIPTYLVSSLACNHVTVSLSGDGGDELFGGYNRHFWVDDIWKKIRSYPVNIRKCVAYCLSSISPDQWNNIFILLKGIIPNKYNQQLPGDKIHKLSKILGAQSPHEIYSTLISNWSIPANVVLGGKEPETLLNKELRTTKIEEFSHLMMYLDMITYLQDDILVKVDRATMSVSLEGRMPFLDHNIVEFAWRIPLSMKISNNQGKKIVRKLLYQYVPIELIERPKMGFGIPIGNWLRHPLRSWAEELIDYGRLKEEGFFNPMEIRRIWKEHLSGRQGYSYQLWCILMFQSWFENNM